MIDIWNPETFDAELFTLFDENSELTTEYWQLDRQSIDEHRNSQPYQSLKPNPLAAEYSNLQEFRVAPFLGARTIRVWHYTRLLNEEVNYMEEKLALSTLDGLRERLDLLVRIGHLSEDEASSIYKQSPFQTQEVRSNKLYAVTAPLSTSDRGVEPFLESWGGESAYFCLQQPEILEKLKKIGKPRVVEIAVSGHDDLTAYSLAGIALRGWARKKGIGTEPLHQDFTIRQNIQSAKVVKVNSEGEKSFVEIGLEYPNGCHVLSD